MPRKKKTEEPEIIEEVEKTEPAEDENEKPEKPPNEKPAAERAAPVLTVEAGSEIESAEDREDLIWHEVQNAYRTRKMITGILSGVEKTETGGVIAVVDYRGLRVAIPVDEAISLENKDKTDTNTSVYERQSKIIGNMLGAEVDFVVRGIDSKSHSIVGSRKEAELRKRRLFYFDTDSTKRPKIYEGRTVQARVLAVSEKGLRVEVFGAECPIYSRDISWEWIGDVRDSFNIGDRVLVKVTEIRGETAENLSIRASIKETLPDTSGENLKKCRPQGKYAGKIIDIYKGAVFVRLGVGVNAIAHSCQDVRKPCKKDDISFVVTKIDETNKVAIGMITKIIRQYQYV
jgi:ribosomal protein S1